MYFDKNFSLPTGYRFLLKDVISFLVSLDRYASREGARLLDIGCGNQPYKKLFSRYQYVRMDAYADVSQPDIFGSIQDIPFNDGELDACMTVWVMDDLAEPEQGIQEIARVLQSGGYYFAVECQSANIHFPPNDYFRFAPNALIQLCKKHGLEIMSYHSYAGDFASIGFGIISIFRRIFSKLHINRVAEVFYSLAVNVFFRPMDKIARMRTFKNFFECNSLGYCYVFRKI